MVAGEVVHCPVCSAEYPSGTSMCVNDSSILVDGPASIETEDQIDEDHSEIGRLEVVAMKGDADDETVDLFGFEEHPRRIVLVVMIPDDAPGLIEKLEVEGIGARLGEPTDDGGVEVLIHEMNLQEAQAILVDYTGDPSLVDDIDPVADGDGYEMVSRGVGYAMVNVARLRDAGINVRLELGEEGLTQPWAIHCPSEDIERARELLGVHR